MFSFRPDGRAGRCLATLLAVALICTQMQAAVADAMRDSARLGQEAARQSASAFPLPTVNPGGDTLTVFPETAGALEIPLTELFPGTAAGDASALAGLYGDDGAALAAGLAAQTTLRAESSFTGEAYRTLVRGSRRSHPDLTNDPVWGSTEAVFGNFELFATSFAECATTTTVRESAFEARRPDYRTCVRGPNPPPDCTATRHLAVSRVDATVSVGTDGRDVNTWRVDLKSGTGQAIAPSDGNTFVQQVPTLDYAALCASGTVYRSRLVKTVDWPEAPVPGAYDGSYTATVLQPPTCANGLVGVLRLDDDGGRDYFKYAARFFWTFERVDTDSWPWSNAHCPELLNAVTDGLCPSSKVSCTQDPGQFDADRGEKCFVRNGVQVCASQLQPPPLAGLPRTCTEATVETDCDLAGYGAACWTDLQGVPHCPDETAGSEQGCRTLEAQGCAFIRSECVDGTAGAVTGTCYLTRDLYDCGSTATIPTLEASSKQECSGPVRCLGEDCVTVDRTRSRDFVRAVAALNAAQQAAMDAQCESANGAEGGHGDVRTCSVFKGKAQSCKRVGGALTFVDCCNAPTSIGLGQYIDLLTHVSQLDNAIVRLDAGNVLRAGYETLREPVATAWSEVTKPFVDVYSDIAADVFGSTSEIAKEGLVDGMKTLLMKQVATWVGDTFGAAAGNLLFSAAGSGAQAFDSTGALSAEASSGGVQLGGGGAIIGTALNVVMIAYTVYVIINLIIQMVWQCEQSEYELAAKKELRTCTYLGSYCASKALGSCWEDRESYCCFASPLARILQEQIRPQLGLGFGSAKAPACEGIPIDRLAQVDWNRVNLDEWIAILQETGHLPDAANAAEKLNLDRLTGRGSRLNVDGRRKNTLERNIERLRPLDVPELRRLGEEQGWAVGAP